MGKQSKPRKLEAFGKGNVTPIQIAFIVDRYLCDNNFSETRSIFRTEASSLIANSPIHEAPKTLLSLGEMLDEYICLKEQKVMLDQERVIVEQEKSRVQMLLQGMQNVMNAYNASRNIPALNLSVPAGKSVVAMVPQPTLSNNSTPGVPTISQNTLNIHSLPQSINANADSGNFSTPMMNVSLDRKRKVTKAIDATSAAKKSRGRSSMKKISVQDQNTLPQLSNAVNNQIAAQPSSASQTSHENCLPNGSSVAKCLFNQPSNSIRSNSPVPKTPPRTNSSHCDTFISPLSAANCNWDDTPTCCTLISTKRVMISPAKQLAYIESSHCISPTKKSDSEKISSKRDHVRSRLDFDASDIPESLDKSLSNEISTSESEKEVDLFDIDFPNLDALGMDFSFTEMLSDLELPCEGIDFSYLPGPSPSKDITSGSSHECKATQVISEKDTSLQGPDCPTVMKSVTKCITILSPVKNRQSSIKECQCEK